MGWLYMFESYTFCDLKAELARCISIERDGFTDLGMLWPNCPIMLEGFWPKGGDERGPCVSPEIEGIVCDDAME
jgi:hypothetical protein